MQNSLLRKSLISILNLNRVVNISYKLFVNEHYRQTVLKGKPHFYTAKEIPLVLLLSRIIHPHSSLLKGLKKIYFLITSHLQRCSPPCATDLKRLCRPANGLRQRRKT